MTYCGRGQDVEIQIGAEAAGSVLMTAALVLLLAAGAARAHYDNNPIPEVLGVKLGGDIRDYPGMAPARSFENGSTTYERAADENATFNSIPVFAVGYNVYESRIARIHFSIHPEHLSAVLDYLKSIYGEFEVAGDRDYRWYDYYVTTAVYYYEELNEYVVSFRYMPLIDKRISDNLNFHELEHNNVFLNTNINNYEFMISYTHITSKAKFLAGQMAYQRFFDNKQLSGEDSTIAYKTWFGRVYEIDVFFNAKDYENILAKLREKYKAWDEAAFSRDGDYSSWKFGEYAITIYQYDNYPRGRLLYQYWPLLRQARMAEEDYRRRNDAAFDLDGKAPDAPEPSR